MGPTFLSTYLDAVRGLAAFAVVLGHARLHAFGPRDTESLSLGMTAAYYTGSFAHLAVIIFFVISGYLVGGKLYSAGRPGFVPKYLIDRASRIYVVAIPMMVFGFLTMLIQQNLYGHALSLRGEVCDGTFGQLAGSFAFLHRGIVTAPCFNSPFWSLVYEVFYYLFFLAAALALTTDDKRTRWIAGCAAIAFGAYGLFEPKNMLAYSTMWLLGMAAAHPHPFRGRQLGFTLAIVALLFIQAILRAHDPEAKWEVPLTLMMVGSLLLFRQWQPFAMPSALARAFALGAAMSYSLYLAHAPAMNLMRAIAQNGFGQPLGIPLSQGTPFYWYPLFILVGSLAGVACWALFERHTMKLRSLLEHWTGVRPRHQPIPSPLPPKEATQTNL